VITAVPGAQRRSAQPVGRDRVRGDNWAVVSVVGGSFTPAGDTVAPRCEFGNRPVTCPYSPAQIRTAYGIQPLLDQGIDGRGRTVVLYEQAVPADGAAHASNIYQDLAAYRPVLAGAGGTSAGAPPCGSQEAPEDLAGIRQGRTFQVRIFGGGLDPVTGKAGDAG
jgi:hypothetical protein